MSATSAIWTEALDGVLRCVPLDIREAVLMALLAKERKRQREWRESCLAAEQFQRVVLEAVKAGKHNDTNHTMPCPICGTTMEVFVRSPSRVHYQSDCCGHAGEFALVGCPP